MRSVGLQWEASVIKRRLGPVATWMPGPHLAKLHKVNEWTRRTKARRWKRITFFSSKVELIHLFLCFFGFLVFPQFFFMTVFILNKSWFFGWLKYFPTQPIAVSLPRPYKTQLPGTSTGWQRMHHTPRSRGRKKSGGKLLHTIYRISTCFDISSTYGNFWANCSEVTWKWCFFS